MKITIRQWPEICTMEQRQWSWWNGSDRSPCKGQPPSPSRWHMLCVGFTRAPGQRLRQTVLACLPPSFDRPMQMRFAMGSASRLRTGLGRMANGRSKTRLARRRRDSITTSWTPRRKSDLSGRRSTVSIGKAVTRHILGSTSNPPRLPCLRSSSSRRRPYIYI